MSTKPEYFYPVRVKLSSAPELRSNIDGSDVIVHLEQCNDKLYSFLADPVLSLQDGDFVACQVKNSFTFGIVYDISDAQVSYETYLENVLLEEGAHKLIITKIDFDCVTNAIRAKRLYEAEKRIIEARAKLNQEALNNVKARL